MALAVYPRLSVTLGLTQIHHNGKSWWMVMHGDEWWWMVEMWRRLERLQPLLLSSPETATNGLQILAIAGCDMLWLVLAVGCRWPLRVIRSYYHRYCHKSSPPKSDQCSSRVSRQTVHCWVFWAAMVAIFLRWRFSVTKKVHVHRHTMSYIIIQSLNIL